MANNRPTRVEIDCSTGISTVIELTDEEIAAAEAIAAEHQAEQDRRALEEQAKAEAKASALAKLAALGLTEDEAKAIAG